MLRIQVENFSCIAKADYTLGKITVLIGPQASGKSVLSKLAYFFIDFIQNQYTKAAWDLFSIEKLSEDLKSRFSDWFPLSAWGGKKFKIIFEMGDFSLKLTRTSYDDSVRDNLRVWTSQFVKEHYALAAEVSKRIRVKAEKKRTGYDFEFVWEAKRTAMESLRKHVGHAYVSDQTFIPAGRSFFTTLGRAFMAFDQGRALDPITIQFGRLYSSVQEELVYFSPERRGPKIGRAWADLLGGDVIWDQDRPVLKSSDGRIVPFQALSSGQQELLPLILAISVLSRYLSHDKSSHLLYIEEPEAHLFPTAQSQLVNGLSALINGPRDIRLMLTTHSPYVLSKINNLIKAGSLEVKLDEAGKARLDALVPSVSRIRENWVGAYAIIDGELKNIVDDDGLIAADYLDSISGEIGAEFSSLLGLEFGA